AKTQEHNKGWAFHGSPLGGVNTIPTSPAIRGECIPHGYYNVVLTEKEDTMRKIKIHIKQPQKAKREERGPDAARS
ncbi:MAG: hypothetical protein WBV36_18065, partial [Terriglobales bacterium]